MAVELAGAGMCEEPTLFCSCGAEIAPLFLTVEEEAQGLLEGRGNCKCDRVHMVVTIDRGCIECCLEDARALCRARGDIE